MPLSAEEIAELKESFLYNDRNGDGRLEFSEFRAMLRDLASGVSEAEARIGFDIVDTDNDGFIELEEFITWWAER